MRNHIVYCLPEECGHFDRLPSVAETLHGGGEWTNSQSLRDRAICVRSLD